MILILKMARVARLVPSTKVLEVWGRLNFDWFLVHLSPSFLLNAFYERRLINEETKKRRKSSFARLNFYDLSIATLARSRVMAEKEKEMKERGKLAHADYVLRKWLTSCKSNSICKRFSCMVSFRSDGNLFLPFRCNVFLTRR